MALSLTDPNSFSRPDLAIVIHIHLNATVNFTKKILEGNVVLDIEKKRETKFLILDVQGLVLLSIVNVIDKSRLDYCVEKGVDYGSKLSVKLPDTPIIDGDKIKYKIKINYRTSQDSTALQWLSPEQTSGGKHPYLFSQNEAIHARSMLPCQDTPYVKFTYSAKIIAPAELNILMSAIKGEVEEVDNLTKVHQFHQPIPIPSYLIAIAVGAIVSKQIGPRTKVWTEQELLDKSAYEFEETETMLKTAEEICGPYVWVILQFISSTSVPLSFRRFMVLLAILCYLPTSAKEIKTGNVIAFVYILRNQQNSKVNFISRIARYAHCLKFILTSF